MFQVEHVSRQFGPVVANDDVGLEVRPGEIVALLGENGAGKSTLLAILSGYLRPDAGTLVMEGDVLTLQSPADAIEAGIGLVHQHLSLVPTFTVREQLRLSGWNGDPLPAMIATLPLDADISNLSMGERQRLEVAKCLLAHPKVLLLDEPTTILAPSEVGDLLIMLDQLRESGLGIVLVTHKLREALAVADRIVVLRSGRVVGNLVRDRESGWPSDAETTTLRLMFGLDDLPDPFMGSEVSDPRLPAGVSDRVLLDVSALSMAEPDGPRLQGVNLAIRAGEILSIVGVDGQGQRDLAMAIAGYTPSQGRIVLDGQRIDGLGAMARARRGVGLLVDDRIGEAAIGAFSLAENVALPRPRRNEEASAGLMHWAAVRERTADLIDRWHIVPGEPDRPFGTLSGGNMQKLLAGAVLDRNPRLLIALNPMQGLDWQTTTRLWSEFNRHCESGSAVLVFTGDMDEALAHSHRVAAIAGGQVSEPMVAGSANRELLARQMVGEW